MASVLLALRDVMANTTATQQRPHDATASSEAVEVVFELLGKAFSAVTQVRCLRAAEYFGHAASAARALWGDKGALCVVHALLGQSNVLVAKAQGTTAVDDAVPLWQEAQRLLAECRHILIARLSANTCLLGRCFSVEEDFYIRSKEMMREAGGVAQDKALCRSVKHEVGYSACMDAACRGLEFAYPAAAYPGVLRIPPQTGEVRSDTQAFALRCLGTVATATYIRETYDRAFANFLCDLLASNDLEQPFKAEVARAWNRPALQNALRARGVFDEDQAAIDEQAKISEMFDKRAAADRAKHGLRWCALPSCAKQELHVFDFKACSVCKAVVYCSAEHGALHWTRGHRKECAALKAAGAKPRSTADAGEGGAGVVDTSFGF